MTIQFFLGHLGACVLLIIAENYNTEPCISGHDTQIHMQSEMVGHADPSACRYRNTWIYTQITHGKLPADGGTSYSKYLRALNFAILTGELHPVNNIEYIFTFFLLVFGCCLNGYVTGNIMGLLSNSEEATRLLEQKESLQSKLVESGASEATLSSISEYYQFLSTPEGSLISFQEKALSSLPYLLDTAVNVEIKQDILLLCPFLDLSQNTGLLRNLCKIMSLCIFSAGDCIINAGELGQEMYFVESGVVEILATDGITVYSKLHGGSFFGETGLFFKSRRNATVRSKTVTTCYKLTKYDFKRELASHSVDYDKMSKEFLRLKQQNERRNNAIDTNLANSKDPEEKLNKIIIVNPEEIDECKTVYDFLRTLSQDPKFNVVWLCIGIASLFYFYFVIPFRIAFLFGGGGFNAYYSLIIDFLLDFYWVLDILLKSFVVVDQKHLHQVMTYYIPQGNQY